MPTVLTVDDSRLVRTIVARQAREIGLAVEEAEDGAAALKKLSSQHYDLLVLDVTMPNLDGPGMLARMRESGDTTPVIMLTSESKRSVVVGLMKLGIEDYILKPFQDDELKKKMLKALKMAAPGAAGAAGEGAAAKGGGDILLIDDMESVGTRFRELAPSRLSTTCVTNVADAAAACRGGRFKLILMDMDMPGVDCSSLVRQLKILQPDAQMAGMAVRSQASAQETARALGLATILFKPFDDAAIDGVLMRFFDEGSLVTTASNVVTVGTFRGRESHLDRYFSRLVQATVAALDGIAAACIADAILDLRSAPPLPDFLTRFVLDVKEKSERIGVNVKLVGSGEVVKALRELADTKDIPVFTTVEEAGRSKGAA